MKKRIKIFSLIILAIAVLQGFIIEQKYFDPNNTTTWIINNGVIDQDLRTTNTPGFQWPVGSGKFAIFSAGLTVAAYINSQIKMASCYSNGELAPGYIIDSAGIPVARTDSRFKINKVKKGDNHITNPDWYHWGDLEQFGAPYIDVNNNGHYEYLIDTPGVRNASATVFCCLTDGFPENHSNSGGFGGGTSPLYAEYHITAWGYDNPAVEDLHFIKWEVINKNKFKWDSTIFSIVCDPDLGDPVDDYIGCDTLRNMGYGYNYDNFDDTNGISGGYGLNPPAVGIKWIRGAKLNNVYLGMTSFFQMWKNGYHGGWCEREGVYLPVEAYNYMKGLKSDGTPCVVPNTNPPLITAKCYSGDPETNTGWTEYKGMITNCGGSLTGQYIVPNPNVDKKFCMSSGSKYLTVMPGDTQKIVIAQIIARGNNNLNSVTKLKQLSDAAQNFYDTQFPIGVNNNSSSIPSEYKLYQNYPNPFNPTTKIKIEIRTPLPPFGKGEMVSLKIYDILGGEIATLIKELLIPGTYEVEWNGSNYSSGIYFYRLQYNNYTETKRMVLLK